MSGKRSRRGARLANEITITLLNEIGVIIELFLKIYLNMVLVTSSCNNKGMMLVQILAVNLYLYQNTKHSHVFEQVNETKLNMFISKKTQWNSCKEFIGSGTLSIF